MARRALAMAESVAWQIRQTGETVPEDVVMHAVRKALTGGVAIGNPFLYAKAAALNFRDKSASRAIEDGLEAVAEERRAEAAGEPRTGTWTSIREKMPEPIARWTKADWSDPSPHGQFMAQMADAIARKPDYPLRGGVTAHDKALDTVAMLFRAPGEGAAHFIRRKVRVTDPQGAQYVTEVILPICLGRHDVNWAMTWMWGWLASVERCALAVRSGSPSPPEIPHPYYDLILALTRERDRNNPDIVEGSVKYSDTGEKNARG